VSYGAIMPVMTPTALSMSDAERAEMCVMSTSTSLTERRLKGGDFSSVAQLVEAIELLAEHWIDNPKPLIRHTLAQDIIQRVRRGRRTFHQIKSATDH
jgi:hypothetical protein